MSAFVEKLRLRQDESMAALMLDWIILSACRTGEARFAVWSEIDRERGIWQIPAQRMKMRRDHAVPITARMSEILNLLYPEEGEPDADALLFPGPKNNGKPLSEMAALMLLKRMGYGAYTVHGFRASFKGWAATETEFPRELIEEQLAHQLGAVERAYLRVPAVDRRRPMMEAWSAFVDGTPMDVTKGNVVALASRNAGR